MRSLFSTRWLVIGACLAGMALLPAIPRAEPRDEVLVDILFTSDIHGHIDRGRATFLNPNFPPPLGGGASAAAYIKEAREAAAATGRPFFLFDSGDLFQGTPVGMKTQGTAVVEWMNEMQYTACALGNHDFDKGWQNTARLCSLATFPMLGANIVNTETKKTVPWVDESFVVEVEGFKIAILGYCTETTANMSFAENVKGIEFLPIHEVLAEDARKAREAGADLVFALMHSGLPYKPERENEYRKMLDREAKGDLVRWGMNAMEMSHVTWGVDVIFGGHTHQGYDEPWEDPRTHTLVFEPYANGSSIGHVTFRLDRKTKSIVGFDTHHQRGALITLFEEEFWPDKLVSENIEAQVKEAEKGLDVVIGETTVNLMRGSANNALMGFVVADAYREVLRADAGLQNTGGVRADIAPGRITERDLIAVSPFDNQMVIVQMKGSLLHAILEDKVRGNAGGIFVSGVKCRYDLSRPDGDRIVSLTVGDAPIDTTRVYKVAMTNYLAEGNSGLWRLREELSTDAYLYTGYSDIDCLREYIRTKVILQPKNDGRWVKVSGDQ